jgi:hypothetical protein
MKGELNKLIVFLKQDEIANISTIGFIENNPITEIIEINNSYLIKGTSDVEWTCVVCCNENDLRDLLYKSVSNTYFASVEDWMLPIITEKRKADWILTTMRYFLPEDVEVPENKIEVIPLTTDHIGFIISQSNYKQF